jgi:hydroxyethylthiazole kinase
MVTISNGHPLATRVTAMGCALGALVAAFCAVEDEPFVAAFAALLTAGIAGEVAAEKSQGPGTFQPAFLDALANLDEATVHTRARLS